MSLPTKLFTVDGWTLWYDPNIERWDSKGGLKIIGPNHNFQWYRLQDYASVVSIPKSIPPAIADQMRAYLRLIQ